MQVVKPNVYAFYKLRNRSSELSCLVKISLSFLSSTAVRFVPCPIAAELSNLAYPWVCTAPVIFCRLAPSALTATVTDAGGLRNIVGSYWTVTAQ